MQTELFQKALRQLKQKQPSPITKVMNKKIMQTDNAVRDKEIVKKKNKEVLRSVTRSEMSREPADQRRSWRKVQFYPRLENNFTFPQISLKNLVLSGTDRFIQINGL